MDEVLGSFIISALIWFLALCVMLVMNPVAALALIVSAPFVISTLVLIILLARR